MSRLSFRDWKYSLAIPSSSEREDPDAEDEDELTARVMRSSTGSRNLVSTSVMGSCVARYVRYSLMSDIDGAGMSRVEVKDART